MAEQQAQPKTINDAAQQNRRQMKKAQAALRREKREKTRARAKTIREGSALKALERVEEGHLLNDPSYHAGSFYQHIAKSRYGDRKPVFTTLSIVSIVRLARSFKLADWLVIEQQPGWLTRAITAIRTTPTELSDWFPFWSQVRALNSQWSNIILLEITYELWQGSLVNLIDGVLCLSKGVLPKFDTGSPTSKVETHPSRPSTLSQNLASSTDQMTHASSATSWYTTVLESDPMSTPTELGSRDACLPTSSTAHQPGSKIQQNTARYETLQDDNSYIATDTAMAKSALSQYIKTWFQNDSTRIAALHHRMRNLDREYLLDLYNVITGSQGLDIRNMKEVFLSAWGELEKSEGFQLERLLGLSHTVSLAMKVAHKGDYTLELKVPRNTALMMIQRFPLTLHLDPLESYGTSFT